MNTSIPESISTEKRLSSLDQRSQLTRRLGVAIITPLALVVVLGVVLGRQLLAMAEDAAWVEHTDQVIAHANETLRQIADQESALSGYLLSRDRALLEPFDEAHPLEGFS